MPTPQAKALHVSPLQQERLQRLVHRTTSAQRLVKRGHIILEAAEGRSWLWRVKGPPCRIDR